MSAIFETHTDLTVAGGPVRLYRGGNIKGPPLLLLHGAMFDTARGVWREVAPALAADYHVHLIDMPRHGGSRPWRGTLDDVFYRRFIHELLDALQLERVALIGLSMGGGIAAGYAIDHPERVSALIAIGPGGIGAKRQAQFITWLSIRTPGVMRMTTWYLARFPQAIRKSMLGFLTAGADTRGFETIVDLVTEEAQAKQQHRERALDDWQIRSYGPFSMRLDLLPLLHKLSVPTLWIRGDKDQLVGHAELVAAADAAPASRLITMTDAGHIVTYDQPDEFNRLAREFLASAIASSA
ncbi:alpha/beta fold hydrolase [Microbacterium sp. A93]|uniref:alpha/beta fold hydrolase n=1 Tax=Microbacterium sp. A93 TaxID=3450716 RepID=UPI003F4355F2